MHPALSIILFTTLSGAGLGLGLWFGVASYGASNAGTVIGAGTAILLSSIGLVCSVFHLRRPLRAWRALSQWRSSWLSREGILAPTALFLLFVQAGALWLESPFAPWLGLTAAFLCLAAILATSMIYAQIRAVAAWCTPLTPFLFIAFAAAAGAFLACAVPGVPVFGSKGFAVAAIALNIGAWILQYSWWRRLDRVGTGTSTPETATGLGQMGQVRLLEPPHTGTNYLLDEMGYVVARRHAAKLRLIALILGCGFAILLLAVGIAVGHVPAFAVFAALLQLAGTGIARWLFFAQARHAVTLYY